MRNQLACLALFALTAAPQAALAQDTTPRPSASAPIPKEISLVDEGALGSVYRQSGTSLRLYTHDSDPIGQSTCNAGCDSAWPAVIAPADATPLGDWTVVVRADGTRQWALKGKPVYVRYHDAPAQPTGVGIAGWHVLPYMPKP